MPFVHIKSLPLSSGFQPTEIIGDICKDFSEGVGVGIEHVTVTWEYFSEGHYAVAGIVAETQPEKTHPILVDLLAPDFNSEEQVVKMLQVLGLSISSRAKVRIDNIFINHRVAHSGGVFDSGTVVQW